MGTVNVDVVEFMLKNDDDIVVHDVLLLNDALVADKLFVNDNDVPLIAPVDKFAYKLAFVFIEFYMISAL